MSIKPAMSAHTISSDIYTVIRKDIIAGCYEPGEKLRIESMRKRYDVGNSPLREALTRLASVGLLAQKDQRGFCVPVISKADLTDICNTRIHIEVAALKLSIAQGGDEWEAKIVSTFHCLQKAQLKREADTEHWEKIHSDFHFSLIAACQSPSMLRFCRILHDQFDRYRRLAPSNTNCRELLDQQHREIMERVLSKDNDCAGLLLTEHIKLSAASAFTLFED